LCTKLCISISLICKWHLKHVQPPYNSNNQGVFVSLSCTSNFIKATVFAWNVCLHKFSKLNFLRYTHYGRVVCVMQLTTKGTSYAGPRSLVPWSIVYTYPVLCGLSGIYCQLFMELNTSGLVIHILLYMYTNSPFTLV